MTYLGMQVIIEGLALAAFGLIRNLATEPLGKALNAYVMQDEARHVMFGRLALRDYYPQLTAGRARRARGVLRRGVLPDARPLPRRGGLGAHRAAQEVAEYVEHSEMMQRVPRLPVHAHRADPEGHRAVGARIQSAFTDMGVIQFAESDLDAEMANDEAAAEELDTQMAHIKEVAATADD